MYRFAILVIALSFYLGFFTPSVTAQVADMFLRKDVSIIFSKEVPEQGDSLTVFVESNTIDLSRARATWFVDGVSKKTANAKDRLTLTVPYKSETLVSVSVETGEGMIITSERSIMPQSLTLLWQADSYVPPFYKGKRKLPFEGTVTFIPIGTLRERDGVVIPPSELVYTWKKNGTVLGSLSGLGKSTLTLQSDIIGREFDIVLNVSSRTGEALAMTGTYVEPTTIDTIIYKDDPLTGLELNRAGNRGIFSFEGETHFFVIPYFVSAFRTGDPRIKSVWTINNEKADTSGPWDIRVRQSGTETVGSITASILNTLYDLQNSNTQIPVFFGGTQTQ